MEVTGFGGRGKYTTDHIQLWLKVGPIASLAQFHVVKTEVSYHVLLGRPWLHKHRLVPSTYHQCVKGRFKDAQWKQQGLVEGVSTLQATFSYG